VAKIVQRFRGQDLRFEVIADAFLTSLQHAGYFAQERGDCEGDLDAAFGFALVYDALVPGAQGGWGHNQERMDDYQVCIHPEAFLFTASANFAHRNLGAAEQNIGYFSSLLAD